jgi:hypothetical protein
MTKVVLMFLSAIWLAIGFSAFAMMALLYALFGHKFNHELVWIWFAFLRVF